MKTYIIVTTKKIAEHTEDVCFACLITLREDEILVKEDVQKILNSNPHFRAHFYNYNYEDKFNWEEWRATGYNFLYNDKWVGANFPRLSNKN